MTKEIGPKERAQREMRERNFEERAKVKKPSTADLRNKIAKVKPMTKHGGRRGR